MKLKKVWIYSLLALLSLFSCGTPCRAGGYLSYPITKFVDGDTVEVYIDQLPKHLSKYKIRVYGVDTPEKGWRAECDSEAKLAIKASKFTEDFISSGHQVYFDLKKHDKYGGRILGDIIVDGKSLRYSLIDAGLAREYYGDKKKSWCK